MNTYWPVRPVNRSMSVATWSRVNATKLTTVSNSPPASAASIEAGSRMSAWRTVTPGGSGRAEVRPRLITVTSCPAASAAGAHAELMMPVPPMNATLSAAMRPPYGGS